MYPRRLPEHLENLPNDNFMEYEPNWRGNIQLNSATTSVSFQGEYPGFMLNLFQGNLLTFNPLIQSQSEISTKVLLVGLLKTPEIKKGRLFIVRQISRKIEKEFMINTNAINLIDLDGLTNDVADPLCLYSPGMAGIPIFFSHDTAYRFMSLEHSYPLHEVTVFDDNALRHGFLKGIKSHWINFLNKNVSP